MNRTDNKLKPCPFCGGRVDGVKGVGGIMFFMCRSCGAIVSFRGADFEPAASVAFNKRKS